MQCKFNWPKPRSNNINGTNLMHQMGMHTINVSAQMLEANILKIQNLIKSFKSWKDQTESKIWPKSVQTIKGSNWILWIINNCRMVFLSNRNIYINPKVLFISNLFAMFLKIHFVEKPSFLLIFDTELCDTYFRFEFSSDISIVVILLFTFTF